MCHTPSCTHALPDENIEPEPFLATAEHDEQELEAQVPQPI
jgi:hypothetical protein